MKKYLAEFLGTLLLVLFGTGVAVISGCNLITTSLAFGTILYVCIHIFGSISGCHLNPAITLAMYLSKKISGKDALCYIIAQILGALWGTSLLYLVLSECGIGILNLGANGFDGMSLVNISCYGALLVETMLTFAFVYVILMVTSKKSNSCSSGFIISGMLLLVNMFGINLTGTSVNPARSLAPALFMGGEALSQVWVFIVAPLFGACLASVVFKYLYNEN